MQTPHSRGRPVMYDLNVRCRSSREKDRQQFLLRCIELGWTTIAWNVTGNARHFTSPYSTSLRIVSHAHVVQSLFYLMCTSSLHFFSVVFGKLNASNTKISTPVALNPIQCTMAAKLLSMAPPHKTNASMKASADMKDSTSSFIKQYSRITVVVDELSEAQALHSSNDILNQFDIVAVTPGNQKVLALCCQQANVDIIAIDFRNRSLNLNKKLLDTAVQRGICFELLYGPMLFASSGRQNVISNSRVLIQYLRGKHLILSSGCETMGGVRAPKDAMNILVRII